MIAIESLLNFIKRNFAEEQIWINYFKIDLIFVEIDCFSVCSDKLALEITTEEIQVATVSKEPVLDFSLYDFQIKNNLVAEQYLLKLKEEGKYFQL